MVYSLHGNTTLITGSDRGIGAATVERMASEGIKGTNSR